MNSPLFPVGFAVRIARYTGLISPTHQPFVPSDLIRCHIEGIRLNPYVDEDWDHEKEEPVRKVSYPEGWQYWAVTDAGKPWGWVSEEELVKAGYVPPAKEAAA